MFSQRVPRCSLSSASTSSLEDIISASRSTASELDRTFESWISREINCSFHFELEGMFQIDIARMSTECHVPTGKKFKTKEIYGLTITIVFLFLLGARIT